jgi:hypothetical protein
VLDQIQLGLQALPAPKKNRTNASGDRGPHNRQERGNTYKDSGGNYKGGGSGKVVGSGDGPSGRAYKPKRKPAVTA